MGKTQSAPGTGTYYEKNKIRLAARRYGMDEAVLRQHLADANDTCMLCLNGLEGRYHIDHCHDTGAFRGILCNNCNVGLGWFKHDIERLALAIRYLS